MRSGWLVPLAQLTFVRRPTACQSCLGVAFASLSIDLLLSRTGTQLLHRPDAWELSKPFEWVVLAAFASSRSCELVWNYSFICALFSAHTTTFDTSQYTRRTRPHHCRNIRWSLAIIIQIQIQIQSWLASDIKGLIRTVNDPTANNTDRHTTVLHVLSVGPVSVPMRFSRQKNAASVGAKTWLAIVIVIVDVLFAEYAITKRTTEKNKLRGKN